MAGPHLQEDVLMYGGSRQDLHPNHVTSWQMASEFLAEGSGFKTQVRSQPCLQLAAIYSYLCR